MRARSGSGAGGGRAHDREILALAVPALGALVAEPLFLLADSAIVGRLGTTPLAGLGIAAAVLSTAVNLFVFLAYGTTASVARRLGAGERRAAVAEGVDGMWLAAALGSTVAVAGRPAVPALVRLFHASAAVDAQAVTYLRWALPGIPAMLVVLAATGVLRGLQDTRTPLAVAGTGAGVNAGLNLLLVHGVGLGIAGSALGTSLTQLGMAVATGGVVIRGARRLGAPLRPHPAGVRASGRAGVPLLVRTLALRAALLVTTYAATAPGHGRARRAPGGIEPLVAACAGPGRAGHCRAGVDREGSRRGRPRRGACGHPADARLGGLGGAVLGALLLAGGPLLALGFSADPAVRSALVAALVVAAVAQPLSGYVFVLDGVLIGAGDGRFLAVAGVVQVLLYAPLALTVAAHGPHGTAGLVWLWVAYAGGYMLSRAVFLGLRAHSDAWLVTGASR